MPDKIAGAIYGAYNSYLRGKGYTENQILNFSFKDEKHASDIIKDVTDKVLTLEEGIRLANILAEGRVESQLQKGIELPLDTVVYHEPRRTARTKKQEIEQISRGSDDFSWDSSVLSIFNRKDVLDVSRKLEINMQLINTEEMDEIIEALGKNHILPKSKYIGDVRIEEMLRSSGYEI